MCIRDRIKELFNRPAKLKKMAESMKRWKSKCATEEVVKRMYEVCDWEDLQEADFIASEPRLAEVVS